MNSNTIINPFTDNTLKKQIYMNLIKKSLIFTVVILILSACAIAPKNKVNDMATEKPTLKDYKTGEKWTWDWKRSVNGEVRAQGEDYQEVVKYNNTLGFNYGKDTVKIAAILDRKPSKTPRYDWPLKVGKKWKYEVTWSNDEGTTGKTSQDAEIVSYNKVTVAAGKFMAYKIVYTGKITNSRGYNANITDIWWYAPKVKKYIKHTQNDGEGLYINELIKYSNPN